MESSHDKSKRNAIKNNKESPKTFTSMAFRTASDMIASIVIGTGLGLYGDSYFNCFPFLSILGAILGIASGFWQVYKLTKAWIKTDG